MRRCRASRRTRRGMAWPAAGDHDPAVGWQPQSAARRQGQRRAGAIRWLRQSAPDRPGRHRQERLGQAGLQQHPPRRSKAASPASPRASPRCSGAARPTSRICAGRRRCPRRRTSFAPLAASWAFPRRSWTRRSISAGARPSAKSKRYRKAARWPAPAWFISPPTGCLRAKPRCSPRTRPSPRCC